jgi:uncharacterized cupredoxin-like copper-binding protein
VTRLIDALRAVPRRPTAGLAALALAGAVLSACGGGSSGTAAGTTSSAQTSSSAAAASSGGSTSGSSAEAESVTATEADFSISLDDDHLKAGNLRITVKNDGHATHDLVVEQNGSRLAKSDVVSPGDSTTLTVALQPGTYVFYCSIGNHRAMGMQTTVTVS